MGLVSICLVGKDASGHVLLRDPKNTHRRLWECGIRLWGRLVSPKTHSRSVWMNEAQEGLVGGRFALGANGVMLLEGREMGEDPSHIERGLRTACHPCAGAGEGEEAQKTGGG